ncbi:hypothetical protein LguiB_012536 [Lonicera macranthoides]
MEKKRRKSASSSSSPIAVPEEIVFEILKELPAKTLVRFRAVSKLWCSILDDPIFVDSHRTRSHTRIGGIRILCQYKEKPSRLKIYSTDPQGGSTVPFLTLPVGILNYHDYNVTCLQSVNGLVCSKNCIWNPSTRESIDLPPISIDGTELMQIRKEGCHVYQRNLLGFDSVTKQYKVVNACEICFGKIKRVEFKILTLGTDSYWRNLDSIPDNLGVRTVLLEVYCIDDVIFCSGRVNSSIVIVAFEVGPEKFRVIKLPNIELDSCTVLDRMIQVRGHLGFTISRVKARDVYEIDQVINVDYVDRRDIDYEDEVVKVMNIWILEDYHKQQWRKETLTFLLRREDRHYGLVRMITEAMGSIHTNEILLYSRIYNLSHDTIHSCSYFDLETKSLRMVPKVTELLKEYERPEDYGEDLEEAYDKLAQSPSLAEFTKHVECLFRLKPPN